MKTKNRHIFSSFYKYMGLSGEQSETQCEIGINGGSPVRFTLLLCDLIPVYRFTVFIVYCSLIHSLMQQIASGHWNTNRVPAYKLPTLLVRSQVIHRCEDTEINGDYRSISIGCYSRRRPLTLQTQGSSIFGSVPQVLCCCIYIH